MTWYYNFWKYHNKWPSAKFYRAITRSSRILLFYVNNICKIEFIYFTFKNLLFSSLKDLVIVSSVVANTRGILAEPTDTDVSVPRYIRYLHVVLGLYTSLSSFLSVSYNHLLFSDREIFILTKYHFKIHFDTQTYCYL